MVSRHSGAVASLIFLLAAPLFPPPRLTKTFPLYLSLSPSALFCQIDDTGVNWSYLSVCEHLFSPTGLTLSFFFQWVDKPELDIIAKQL